MLTCDPPSKKSWKKFCREKIIHRDNEKLIVEIFRNNYFEYVHPNDFSIERKQVHPILLFPHTAYDMVRMKRNIKFIMNEIPIKQFQILKGLAKDTICDMCTLNETQTTLHVISRCTKIITDKKIIADRQLIIETTILIQRIR